MPVALGQGKQGGGAVDCFGTVGAWVSRTITSGSPLSRRGCFYAARGKTSVSWSGRLHSAKLRRSLSGGCVWLNWRGLAWRGLAWRWKGRQCLGDGRLAGLLGGRLLQHLLPLVRWQRRADHGSYFFPKGTRSVL
jgi:hypothetical protein